MQCSNRRPRIRWDHVQQKNQTVSVWRYCFVCSASEILKNLCPVWKAYLNLHEIVSIKLKLSSATDRLKWTQPAAASRLWQRLEPRGHGRGPAQEAAGQRSCVRLLCSVTVRPWQEPSTQGKETFSQRQGWNWRETVHSHTL